MDGEQIPYRVKGVGPLPVPEQISSTDEREFSTLKNVHQIFTEKLQELDAWHAFDLQISEMKLAQQIKAHRLAYDILAPLHETVVNAIKKIDVNFKG